MVKEYKGQDQSNWLDELVYRLTYATYHNAYKDSGHKVKDTVKDLTYKQLKELIDVIRFNSDDIMNFIFFVNVCKKK